MGRIVGIDLGTTNSVLSVLEEGTPRVVPIDGRPTVPSVVAYTPSGETLVGVAAKNQAAVNPNRTIRSVKRLIGRRRHEVAQEERELLVPLVGEPEALVRIQIGDEALTPSQISAEILRYIKEQGEEALGEEITDAVITVPAYFNDTQRQATKAAGRIAGFKVRRIVNEPTAAALAYGYAEALDARIAVFDLGGGTFDISILSVKEGVFEVLATNGNTHLGGDDFDDRIVAWALEEVESRHGLRLREDDSAMQRLRTAAEEAKCTLSSQETTELRLPFLTQDADGQPINVALTLTRERLEELIGDLIEATVPPCEQALADAGLKPEEIDDVILVGGSTRIPAVQALVREIFRREPNATVNPDEVVALGAAVQAGILEQSIENILLLDVTPLSLGIETYGGTVTTLIPRNTTIPTSQSELFSTAVDNQTSVSIHVVQGERDLAKDNRTLARFELSGIPPMAKGVPQIEVTFDIDANGILKVTARERRSGQEMSVRITGVGELSEEEVNRIIEESFAHAEEDVRMRMLIEARVEAEGVLTATRKALEGYGHLIDEDERWTIEDAIADLEEACEGDDVQAIRNGTDYLDEVTQHLADVIVTAVLKERLEEEESASS